MNKSAFGKRMRDAREKNGISLRAFAAQIGFSAAYISDIERGLRLPPVNETVEKIEKLLGISGLTRLAQIERIGVKYNEISPEGAAKIADIMAREGLKI